RRRGRCRDRRRAERRRLLPGILPGAHRPRRAGDVAMIDAVAVDGPAGAGKSSASRALAGRLGFVHVDTGAMYRAVGVLADARGVALDDANALERLVADLVLEFTPSGRLVADGEDVTEAIRRPRAGELASRVSTEPAVRRRL